ncbi:MAG: alpha/beta hydrolase [Xenococcaceae cyanobacterium]
MKPDQEPSSKPKSAARRYLIKVGCTAWILLGGLSVVLFVLHRFGVINPWQFPLKHIGVFLGCGGLACFLLAFILKAWQKKGSCTNRSGVTKRVSNHWLKQIYRFVLVTLIAINALAYILAYGMTHLRSPGHFGVGIPKPLNSRLPTDIGRAYVTHRIPINQSEWLECWFIRTQHASSKGTVLLFPGNLGTKGSQLIAPAQSFSALGYDSLLVDFRGVGGSSGNTITIGMREAQDVAVAVSYAQQLNLKPPIVLYGVSMGSAAILRAISVERVKPSAIILELPFARLVNTVKSRLRDKKIPPSPTAELLVFWGGLHHGFNGLFHNPVTYASDVKCPTLVLHGEKDKWTSVAEIDELFQNLRGPKKLVISPTAGHHQLIGVDKQLWYDILVQFLESI